MRTAQERSEAVAPGRHHPRTFAGAVAIMAIVALTGGISAASAATSLSAASSCHEVAPTSLAADMEAYLAYRRAIAGLKAALAHHDAHAASTFRETIRRLSIPGVLCHLAASRERILAGMAAAKGYHDFRMVATFREQLAAITLPRE
jgi:hypothetical protein